MSGRKQYLYRLEVQLPEGLRLFEQPDTPAARAFVEDMLDDPSEWYWPAWWNRVYRSRSGAKKRADLLRSYGATVTVYRSDPVTWPNAGRGHEVAL